MLIIYLNFLIYAHFDQVRVINFVKIILHMWLVLILFMYHVVSVNNRIKTARSQTGVLVYELV